MSIPLFPVYLASQNYKPADKGSYYLVARDGIYFRQECDLGSAFVKVKEIPHLIPAPTEVRLSVPKIKGVVVAKAFAFFREVFTQHRSESYVTLLYNKELGEFDIHVPKQEVTYSSVSYDRGDNGVRDGWRPIGTIHSHCDFSAFHSGVDTGDEASFDGIHITLGNVNRDEFSMVSSVVFSDNRRQHDPVELIDNVCHSSTTDVEERGHVAGTTYTRRENLFRLDLTAEQRDEFCLWCDQQLPEAMKRVSKKFVATYRLSGNLYQRDFDSGYDSDRGGSRHKYNPLDRSSFGWTKDDVRGADDDVDLEEAMSDDVDAVGHEYNRAEDLSLGYEVELECSAFDKYVKGFPEDFSRNGGANAD